MKLAKVLAKIGKKITSNPTVVKTGIKFKKNLPTIAVVGGGLLCVVAYGLAIHEATTVDDILEEHEEELDAIEETIEDEKEIRKQTTKRYIKTGVKVAAHFAPSFLALGLGITAIGYSHAALNGRNLALTASLASLGDAFSQYRERVTETIGEEAERKLRYGLEESTEVKIKTEDGSDQSVIIYRKSEKPLTSPYARVFNEDNPYFDKTHPDFNVLFLRNTQSMLNDKLEIEHFLFLNDVYTALGFKRTPDGQLMGWSFDPKNPRYFDMGVYNINNKDVASFINGEVDSILLDFNVDPQPIYTML